MSLEPEFLQVSTGQITVEPLSTVSDYGSPSYSTTSQTYTAYEEPGTDLVVTGEGMQEIATATVFVLSSSATIGTQDRITLADGRQPRILAVNPMNDEDGQHHVELMIK